MIHDVIRRIDERLEAVGLSASAASLKSGLSADAIRNIRRRAAADDNASISTNTVAALATVLQTTSAWLLEGVGDASQNPPEVAPSDVRLVPARSAGIVEAGTFREVDDFDQSEPETVFVPADRQFPDARVLLFDVSGNSMNNLKPVPILPGTTAVTLAFEDVADRVSVRDGMVVVLERTRDGGHTREWSIKQVQSYTDRVEFHPRSTDPRYKPIVVRHDADADDGTVVQIIALLRSVITRFPEFS